jgi:hypothetical protein
VVFAAGLAAITIRGAKNYGLFEITNQNVSFWRFWLFVIK